LVAIVDPDDADRVFTRDLLVNSGKAHVVGTARELGELGRLMTAEPDIVFLDVRAPTGTDAAAPNGLATAIRAVRQMSPRCEVILTARPDLQLDLSDAVMAGARGLVRKRVAVGQMLSIMQNVFEAEQLKRQHFEQTNKAESNRGRGGQFIAVYSPKGGVGCTTIATNLALALQGTTGGRVALLDFDLQFGDVDVLLDLHSTHGVHELVHSTDDLDIGILDAVMLKHRSGLSVLLPPPSLDLVNHLTPDTLVAVLKALRKYFDYIVVDTWHSIEDITLSIMDLADTLIVVTTPEIPALRDTRRLLDVTEKRAETRGKVKIVVNRYPSKSAVNLDAIERSFRIKPICTIPSDGTLITAAVNEGVSFLSAQSHAGNNLKQLAALLAGPHGKSGASRQAQMTQAAQTVQAIPDSASTPAQGETAARKRGFGLFKRSAKVQGLAGSESV